jgi:hypothetical protein
MKLKITAFCILILQMSIIGCTHTPNTIVVTPTPTTISSPTTSPLVSPSSKLSTQTLIPFPVETPQPTLEPGQEKGAIQTLLQNNVDCDAPCFWEIIPGETTLENAKRKLVYFRINLQYVTRLENKDYYEFTYEFDNGLSITPHLMVQEGIVGNIQVYIAPELQLPDTPRSWLAYSPEMLVTRYGLPNRVDFFLGRHEPSRYNMQMYFDDKNLITQYGSFDISFVPDGIRVCPVTDQYDSVSIWLGKNQEHPPKLAVPLEEAASLTLEEFAELMLGNPEDACFDLKEEVFP